MVGEFLHMLLGTKRRMANMDLDEIKRDATNKYGEQVSEYVCSVLRKVADDITRQLIAYTKPSFSVIGKPIIAFNPDFYFDVLRDKYGAKYSEEEE